MCIKSYFVFIVIIFCILTNCSVEYKLEIENINKSFTLVFDTKEYISIYEIIIYSLNEDDMSRDFPYESFTMIDGTDEIITSKKNDGNIIVNLFINRNNCLPFYTNILYKYNIKSWQGFLFSGYFMAVKIDNPYDQIEIDLNNLDDNIVFLSKRN